MKLLQKLMSTPKQSKKALKRERKQVIDDLIKTVGWSKRHEIRVMCEHMDLKEVEEVRSLVEDQQLPRRRAMAEASYLIFPARVLPWDREGTPKRAMWKNYLACLWEHLRVGELVLGRFLKLSLRGAWVWKCFLSHKENIQWHQWVKLAWRKPAP